MPTPQLNGKTRERPTYDDLLWGQLQDTKNEVRETRKELNSRMDRIEQRMDKLEQRFDKLNDKLDETRRELNAKLDALHNGLYVPINHGLIATISTCVIALSVLYSILE